MHYLASQQFGYWTAFTILMAVLVRISSQSLLRGAGLDGAPS